MIYDSLTNRSYDVSVDIMDVANAYLRGAIEGQQHPDATLKMLRKAAEAAAKLVIEEKVAKLRPTVLTSEPSGATF